jgi:archaellum biogenesis protein FlaJ (TadC family)
LLSQKNLFKWKYRMKVAEKVYYIILMSLAFVCYRSPSVFYFLFTQNPHISIPALSVTLFAFNFFGFYLDKLANDSDKKSKKLREKLRDAKKNLISHMDPIVVETLKEIVKSDL